MRIEKLGKVGICLITGCFVKPFNMIIIFFFNRCFGVQDISLQLDRSTILAFQYQDDARWELGTANC